MSLLTAWLALGQELAGLPRYLWTSLEISRGYTDAMSLPGRQWMALMYLVAIGLLAYPLAVVSWRNNGRWAVVAVAMFALTTMVIFKAAFVHADEHVEIGFRAAIMVILLLLPVLWTACSTPPLRRLLLASFVPVFLSGYSFAVFPSTMAHTISAIRNNVRWLASPGQGYETLQRCHQYPSGRRNNEKVIITNWEEICVTLIIVALFFLVLSTAGCCSAKCVKTVYQPVEVKIPVPVEGPALPLPSPPDCGELPPVGEDWRSSAAWLKGCYDVLLTKIEEYVHVIESYNETRAVNSS